MKKVTSADSLILINHYKNILESEGIACEVRNQHLGSVLGEMPFAETWPELWVRNAIDLDRAKQLIDESITDESPEEPWVCPVCREKNERTFAVCWNCGSTYA